MEIQQMLEHLLANKEDTKVNQARMEESLKGEMRLTVSAIEEKMVAIVHSIRSERDGKIQCQSKNVMECKEQGPKELVSRAECQMVPMEEAAVKSSGITKKQHRGQQIAAG
jgi:hypothetical protein